jgi:hypothetical protein
MSKMQCYYKFKKKDNGKKVPTFTSPQEDRATITNCTNPKQDRVHIVNRPIYSILLHDIESSTSMTNQVYYGISIQNLQRFA